MYNLISTNNYPLKWRARVFLASIVAMIALPAYSQNTSVQNSVKAIQLFDRQLIVSDKKWVFRTRFYDVVEAKNGKFAIFSPKSNQYFQFSSVKEFPRYIILPNSYKPQVVGTKWKFKRRDKFFGFNVSVYSRSVKVHARKARTTLLQLEENIDRAKPKRIRIVKGVEEIWCTKNLGKRDRLRVFLNQYYGLSSNMGIPLKNTLTFSGSNPEMTKRLLRVTKVSNSKSWKGFGDIPKGATRGKDIIGVLAGSSGMLDFLYRGK